MKKAISTILLLMLLCICCTANALELNISALPAATLYDLAAQVEAQSQLNALADPSAYRAVTDYGDFERNPASHKDERIMFTGTVIQVSEGNNGRVVYRVAMDGRNSQVFYIQYTRPEGASRLLEDDEVTVYATFTELMTYTSTTNQSITVPSCKAELMIRPVQKAALRTATADELASAMADIDARLTALNAPDAEGYVRLTASNYTDYARREARHQGERLTFSGKVVQVVEGSARTVLRIAVDGDEDRIIYTTHAPEETDIRTLEGDQVTVRATYSGLYSYESTLGGQITIPSCTAAAVTVKGYTPPASFTKDSEGYYTLDSATFADYSRRPGIHSREKICFTGKVLQVIEGSSNSQYRIAVDGNGDQVIYVTLPAAKKTVRALENDQVTVYATFTDLLTYESTMGVAITIPSCTADRLEVEGATGDAQKDAQGRYSVTNANYDAFARNEDAYLYETITFEATVVQVIEGDSYTQYRMAIDGDSDCMFLVQINAEDMALRILEDDEVTVTGIYCGLYSYNSTLGGKITIPSCLVSEYTVDSYVAPAAAAKDAEGYYWITAKNYEEYARNADAHRLEKIRFSGEVIQVVERKNQPNVYRVAVDSDYSCVVYIEYTLPQGASRILEDDIVIVSASYYGLFSYSTTLGSKVTIPAAIAESIGESYKTLRQGSSGASVTQMKERLQELGYFSAGVVLSDQYNATTVERVKLFQKTNGLKETGTADAATLLLLYSDSAKPKPQ